MPEPRQHPNSGNLAVRSPIAGTVQEVGAGAGGDYDRERDLVHIVRTRSRARRVCFCEWPARSPPLRSFGLVALVVMTGLAHPSPLADIGPAPRTVLVDSAGKPFDLASLKGKVVLVSFVYTTCNGVCPATTSSLVPDPEDARAGQALGKLGRVRLDHARPQARHARGPEPLCPALRRRPGQMAFSDRLSPRCRVGHRRLGDVGQDRPHRRPRPSLADLSARSPGPPARDLQPRVPQGRFRAPRRARAARRTSEEITATPRARLPTATA